MARKWMKFFLDAGIPRDSSAEYAVNFEQNRMELDMLPELDKNTLRELNITAMGDIISILRHSKNYLSRVSEPKPDNEQLLKSERQSSERSSSSLTSSNSRSRKEKEEKDSSPAIKKSSRDNNISPEQKSPRESKVSSRLGPPDYNKVSARLGPQVSKTRESSDREEEDGGGPNKSVFKRLGIQSHHSPQPEDVEESKPGNKGIFSRLGPEAELIASESTSRSQSPQEARVSSTSEESSSTPGKGILKIRGSGSGMSRSKSAPNVINLKKAQNSELKLKKRISFGKDEVRYMEASPGIKSRLGYGRCSSPPPPELDQIDNLGLQTELKKIAVGKGKFELKKVMKVVKEMNKSTLRDSLTPERVAAVTSKAKEEKEFYVTSKRNANSEEPLSSKLQISIKNDECQESYNVDKVDLALRAAKLKSNLDQRREDRISASSPKKRLVKIETLEDGSKRRSYIDEDDPILESVPVKKSRYESELKVSNDKKIRLAEGRTATDFTIVRSSTSSSLYSDGVSSVSGQHKTLAQKADIARSKQDTNHRQQDPKKLPKVSYGRAASFGNVIKAEEFNKLSVKDRIGSSEDRDRESRSSRSEDKSSRAKERSSISRDRSPITFGDKSPRSSHSKSSVKDRLGGMGDGGKNVHSRLGNRD